jgi:octaprenyl-diphosphate synthase
MQIDYRERLEKIERALQNALPCKPDDAWHEQIFQIKEEGAPPIIQPCVDLIARGGKRWRPLLMTLVCESLGGGEAALPLSPLVEFCHTASLMHDDIEDNSPQRRGKPAAHLLYGADTAINSGSFLYFLPFVCIDTWDAPPQAQLKLYQLLVLNLRRLHLGQSMDIAWHRDPLFIPSVADYVKMCSLKTGVLARFAAAAGALIANSRVGRLTGDSEQAAQTAALSAALETAAEKMGVGFQILDDVKNLSTGVAGKKRGDDIVEGKKSLPILLFLQDDDRDERLALVQRCFAAAATQGVEAPEVESLIVALDASGAINQAAETGRKLLAEAKTAFAAFDQPAQIEKPDQIEQSSGEKTAPIGLLAGFVDLIA